MDTLKILVVDDEARLRKLVRDFLVRKNYEVIEAGDGAEAIDIFFSTNDIDLIILDVMMPKLDGWEVCREIRKESKVPIIMLTAKTDERDEQLGFDLGVDDYISKPFSVKELLARVKAVLSRSVPSNQTKSRHVIAYKGISLDEEQKSISVDGESVSLTRTEFELLHLLILHLGKVFSRHELIKSIWPCDVIVTDRTIDVNIARLRKKLGIYGSCICSRQGYGYYISHS